MKTDDEKIRDLTIGKLRLLQRLRDKGQLIPGRDWIVLTELHTEGFVRLGAADNGQVEIQGLTKLGRQAAGTPELSAAQQRVLANIRDGKRSSDGFGDDGDGLAHHRYAGQSVGACVGVLLRRKLIEIDDKRWLLTDAGQQVLEAIERERGAPQR